jgi:hypothetical protein
MDDYLQACAKRRSAVLAGLIVDSIQVADSHSKFTLRVWEQLYPVHAHVALRDHDLEPAEL